MAELIWLENQRKTDKSTMSSAAREEPWHIVDSGTFCVSSREDMRAITRKEIERGYEVYQRIQNCDRDDSAMTPEDVAASIPALDNNVDGSGGCRHCARTMQGCTEQSTSVVSVILLETDASDPINKSNADHAVLFEDVNVIVAGGVMCPLAMREGAMKLPWKFIPLREPIIRYLGLATMAKLAQVEGSLEG